MYESTTAPGDSGGPLYLQVGNHWTITDEVYGAGSAGFFDTPTEDAEQQAYIKSTILGVNPSFTFATQTAPTSLTWDADATTAGVQNGSGVWDLQRPNFYDPVTKFNFQFENARGNDVVFGGNSAAAGTVTIAATSLTNATFNSTTVTAHDLTFNAAASGTYTIASSGGTLALATSTNSAGDPTITTNVDAAISAPIVTASGQAVDKVGPGTLTIGGASGTSLQGTWKVTAGTLDVTAAAALGSGGFSDANSTYATAAAPSPSTAAFPPTNTSTSAGPASTGPGP